METKELILRLTSIAGPSGYETNVVDEIEKIMKNFSDETFKTKLGSLICVKKGNGKGKVGLFAHVDQLGFVITKIDKKGFAYVAEIGGWDPKVVIGQRAKIISKDNKVFEGIFGFLAPHLQKKEEKGKVPSFNYLFLDISINKDWKEISVGDLVVLDNIEAFEQNSYIFSPALDNRASCAALIKTAELLQKIKHEVDVYFIFSTQEEEGGPGAPTAAYLSDLDYAFVVDVTHGNENVPGYEKVEINKGPVVAIGPVVNREFNEIVRKTANEFNIQIQFEPIPRRSGTDTDEVQLVRKGIKTQLLSIPLKYMHTPYEKISIQDIENTSKLITFTISALEVQ
ncbi:peptidase M42 [Thermosipho melanesiensis]|uniref:Peptidase M42 family protein n=2 Tax=Thermosipho melanesiensis TaxID=46541 RepID=A6LJ72_THEM4|nr:M20/M25/M40 family metallo-hydrolase [Thermosipho melanesiensis]ABR29973.1 peptidase M42 family protein [Thermosipho melanesiensis BI429]APT73177.1 peptidase M42 [Thermosipho melanesiensis]OOC38573.1 peptidase M42 [Thermosipho melanesiensis]OOC40377.1 peptidase M42 [Thermosipho melanesiensis]OOC40641.1 peptidase M42 [Thermosipho melanesiensis]